MQLIAVVFYRRGVETLPNLDLVPHKATKYFVHSLGTCMYKWVPHGMHAAYTLTCKGKVQIMELTSCRFCSPTPPKSQSSIFCSSTPLKYTKLLLSLCLFTVVVIAYFSSLSQSSRRGLLVRRHEYLTAHLLRHRYRRLRFSQPCRDPGHLGQEDRESDDI